MDAVNWMEHLAPRFLIKWWLHALVSPDIMGNECLANRTKNNHKLYDSLIKKQTKEKVSQWTSFQSERKQSTRVNMKLTYKIAISDSHACPSEDCLGIKMIISHPRSGSRGAKKGAKKTIQIVFTGNFHLPFFRIGLLAQTCWRLSASQYMMLRKNERLMSIWNRNLIFKDNELSSTGHIA